MRKIIKTQVADSENAFQLHCFPNIPVDGAVVAGDGSMDPPAFRRLHENGAVRQDPPPHEKPRGEEVSGKRKNHEAASLEKLETEAFRKGFAKGEAEGLVSARQAARPTIEALEALTQQLDGYRKRLRLHIERETVRLALAVARKILNREPTISEQVILNVVREALRQTEEPDKVLVRLHPEDLELIQSSSDILPDPANEQDRNARMDALTFEADPAISRGGCFIETDFGEIDARIEQQFRVVEDAFQAEMLLIDPYGQDDPVGSEG
ncbi:MAG: FliH/SctL family protein [Desulfobacterales bacterium]